MRITSCTTFGASPWLGSSKQHQSRSADQRARDRHHLQFAAGHVLALSRQQVAQAPGRFRSSRRSANARNGVRLRAIARLRAAVSDGNTRRSSGTQPMPARAISCVGNRVTSRPPNSTLPAPGRRQAEDRPQQRGLACAARAQQRDDFAGGPRRAKRRTAPASRRSTSPCRVRSAGCVPSAERRTHGLSRNSRGVPRAMTCPQWMTLMRSASAEQEAHVVLDDDQRHACA